MMAGQPRSPADVARAVGAGVSRLVADGLSDSEHERQLDELAALYAERTDVRHPFSPHGAPPLRSRQELREHFGRDRPPHPPDRFAQANVVVHRTDDPEVVVIEFSYEIERDGREYSVPMIFVLRVRDGEIVESRDYGHHIEMARAMGRVEELARSLR